MIHVCKNPEMGGGFHFLAHGLLVLLWCLNKTVKAFESVDEIIKGHQTRALF